MQEGVSLGCEEEGSALFLVLILLSLLAVVGLQVHLSARNLEQRTSVDLRFESLRADSGIAKAKVALLNDATVAWAMPVDASLPLVNEDGATVQLTCLRQDPPGPVFLLEARAGAVVVRTWIRLVAVPTQQSVVGRAALVGGGDISLTGHVVVDGRDHSADGLPNGDPGVFGVLAQGNVSIEGRAEVGGVGEAPVHLAAPNTYDPHSDLWTEADATDGLDNDGDGLTDELNPPRSADEALGRTDGSSKALAQRWGTYFTTLADYEAWRTSSNPQESGGAVVYLELAPGSGAVQLTLPDNALNDRWGSPRFPPPQPTIVIATSSAGAPLEVGPLHAPDAFQGALVVDRLRNANGTGSLVGTAFVLEPGSHTVGNGALQVLYSSEVLDSLPGPREVEIEFLYWNRR